MTRLAAVTLAAAALLGACSREPRSAAYFAAHPDAADPILARCRTGALRGPECLTAQSGPLARRNAARLERYRQGFAR